MSRIRTRVLGTLLVLICVHCTGPSASDTKTNWFHACDVSAECDAELSCECGICTRSCTSAAECGDGECSSALESSVQCDAASAERLCLPPSDLTCSEFSVEPDADLGVASAPRCSAEGALVCEGFERPLPANYATWFEDDMTAVVQDCEVRHGEGALHYRSASPGQAQTRIRLPTDVTSGPMHARFFLRLSAAMVLPQQLQVLEFWDREEGDVPERIALFLTAEGVPRVFVGASATTLAPAAPVPLPRDTWLCLEFSVDVQPQDGSASLAVDGTEVLSGSGFSSQPTAPLSVVVIEAQPTTDTQGVDLFVDDLVVATAPIGCD